MPTCQNCGQQWSYKMALKKYIKTNHGMPCPYCGKTQYMTKKAGTNQVSLAFCLYSY